MENAEGLTHEEQIHRQELIRQMDAEGYEFISESDLDGMEEVIRIASEAKRSLKVISDDTIGPKNCLVFRAKDN